MDYSPNSGMVRAGTGLREVRERLGWKLPDVAALLRIKLEYLTAIESGDLTPLPGQAYRAGFIRSYARLLGLDAEEILTRFREAGGLSDAAEAPITYLAPVPDRAVPRGALVLIVLVVLLGVYGVWYRHSATDSHIAESVPPVSAELAPLATTPVTAPAMATPPTATTPSMPPGTAANAIPPGAAASSIPPGAAAPAALDVAPQPPPPGTTPATAPNAAPAPNTPPAAPQATQTAALTIIATGDAWVEVNDATGNILFSKILHAGDSWPVPQEPGLTLTTGNAGGTELITNGKPGVPLGAPSQVLHNYPLTPPAPGAQPAPPALSPTPTTQPPLASPPQAPISQAPAAPAPKPISGSN
jgi:cytoskeleton protein RodZ